MDSNPQPISSQALLVTGLARISWPDRQTDRQQTNLSCDLLYCSYMAITGNC